ncbi:hypothetical protein PFISCL1PPCAC_27994 [Pristionchus fissidentatus]|uniref:Uncharacterized protein n=1 Tax=Pristionchus fissidentatus TaxID=1538716 RepID=A0AAV5WX10_9BILA|nr:hypothetical protein PFISCL1PPCAC_27994 [Pristionchus fissidentatus]
MGIFLFRFLLVYILYFFITICFFLRILIFVLLFLIFILRFLFSFLHLHIFLCTFHVSTSLLFDPITIVSHGGVAADRISFNDVLVFLSERNYSHLVPGAIDTLKHERTARVTLKCAETLPSSTNYFIDIAPSAT